MNSKIKNFINKNVNVFTNYNIILFTLSYYRPKIYNNNVNYRVWSANYVATSFTIQKHDNKPW